MRVPARNPSPNLTTFPEINLGKRERPHHLKNFGVLYHDASDIRLAPMFDVVTTAIYTYTRYPGGPELEDHTMALKLFAGRHPTRTYPTPVELIDFGHRVCGVSHPERVLEAIAQAMSETMAQARGDARVAPGLLAKMRGAWEAGGCW